jgi:hypothetical protein
LHSKEDPGDVENSRKTNILFFNGFSKRSSENLLDLRKDDRIIEFPFGLVEQKLRKFLYNPM